MTEKKIPPIADVKANLAQHGCTLHPDAKIDTINPPSPGSSGTVLILERISDVPEPDYCTHGYVQCIYCYEFCWMGDQSVEMITSGEAFPLCVTCAPKLIPEGTEPIRQVQDHKRKDGPH